jgi:hypothetical protein
MIDRQQVWAQCYALIADLQVYEGDRVRYALPYRLSWIFDEPLIYGAANDNSLL